VNNNLNNIHLTLNLVFKQGNPLFTDGERLGRHICIDFGCFADDGMVCMMPYNRFRIVLRKTGKWSSIMTALQIVNDERFLSEQKQVAELVETINHAIRNGQEFDFTEQGQQLFHIEGSLCNLIVFNDQALDNLLLQTDYLTSRINMPQLMDLMVSSETDGFLEVQDGDLSGGRKVDSYWLNPSELRLASMMALDGYHFTLEEIKAFRNPKIEYSVVTFIGFGGFPLTVDEIIQLENPRTYFGLTLLDCMAGRGYPFTVDEIIQLGNPKNDVLGFSLVENMALAGHRFAESETRELEKLISGYGQIQKEYFSMDAKPISFREMESRCNLSRQRKPLLMVFFDLSNNHRYTDEQIAKSRNPRIAGERFTEAFCMARAGYLYTVEQIKAVGNPKDDSGLTIADWMAKAGNLLTEEELERLNKGQN
jgi:hypothetical protein